EVYTVRIRRREVRSRTCTTYTALFRTDLEIILAVNLAAPVRLCREAARRWRGRQARSDIVNISSVAARTGSPGEYVAYAASKAADRKRTRLNSSHVKSTYAVLRL